MTSYARGTRVTLVGQWGRFAVQLLSLVLLSRLLSPSDFGLMAIVLAVTGVAGILGDFGISLASIQARTVSPQERSSLFWASTRTGLVGTVLCAALAFPLAEVYQHAELGPALLALAPLFVINAASAQFKADLSRRLRFVQMAWTEVLSQAAGLAVAVILILAFDVGFAALVVQQLVVSLVVLTASCWWSGWLPGRPRRITDVRGLRRFGGAVGLTQLLNYISTNVDSIVLGAVVSPFQVGVYARAYQLFGLPTQQIATPLTRVAVPMMSRSWHDEDREHFTGRLARMSGAVCYSIGAVIALAFISADLVVRVVLGPQFHDSGPIFQILLLGAACQVLSYPVFWALVALGRPGRLLLAELPGRLLMIAAIIIVAEHGGGTLGVAWAHSLGLLLISGTAVVTLRSTLGLGWSVFASAFRAFGLYVGAGTASVLLARSLGGDVAASTLTGTLGTVALFLVLIALAMTISRVIRDELVTNLRLVRRVLSAERSPT